MFLFTNPSKIKANTIPSKSAFEYFIFISGADTREDVLFLEGLIKEKKGVTFFMADRFPVRCFILKSSRNISEKEFGIWIGSKYKILSYGEGNKAKEKAYVLYNKQKNNNPQ